MTRPGVLLLHAFPLDSRMWDGVRAPLEAGGWDLRAPDLGEPGGLGGWAERILADGEGRFVAIGSSMGGYLAFELWRQAPERVAGLGLVGTRPGADSAEAKEARNATLGLLDDGGVEALWEQVGAKLTAEPNARARQLVLDQDPARLSAAIVAMRDRPDSTGLLPELDVPVLVAAGSADALISPTESETMAAALPDARLVLLPGIGHLPPLERPDELAEELIRFLDRIA